LANLVAAFRNLPRRRCGHAEVLFWLDDLQWSSIKGFLPAGNGVGHGGSMIAA
jgi:hypothetical protein